MVTKMWVFQNKIGCHSVCIGDVPDSCTELGVFEVGQFNGVILASDGPCCHGNKNVAMWT